MLFRSYPSRWMQRFLFANTISSVDYVGLLAWPNGVNGPATASSPTHGFTMGGTASIYDYSDVERFQFTTTTNSSNVGNLTSAFGAKTVGGSSETHAYAAGGQLNYPTHDINKFLYVYSGSISAIDIGDLKSPPSASHYLDRPTSVDY